jgi:glucose-6-phosphate-specific signal transduction histidine kinase
MHLQIATTKEVRHLVRDDIIKQEAGALDAEGPREVEQPELPLELVDAYGFNLTVTAEQAAILERCRGRQDAVRQKWGQQVQEAGLPPTDALKKLCRKVGGLCILIRSTGCCS